MGNSCASPRKGTLLGLEYWQSTAKLIHLDGSLQQLHHPIKASHVLSQNPNCFICSSEAMYVDCHVPHVSPDEVLQLGQIYFLMPLSQSHSLFSLSQLCALAIKASAALAPGRKTTSYLLRGSGDRRFCKVLVAVNFPVRQGCPQIRL